MAVSVYFSLNLTIVDCKSAYGGSGTSANPCLNLTIVDCKYGLELAAARRELVLISP